MSQMRGLHQLQLLQVTTIDFRTPIIRRLKSPKQRFDSSIFEVAVPCVTEKFSLRICSLPGRTGFEWGSQCFATAWEQERSFCKRVAPDFASIIRVRTDDCSRLSTISHATDSMREARRHIGGGLCKRCKSTGECFLRARFVSGQKRSA
eukprot:TRINITY_DN124989_c0_g1_i1.p2 TRINITY_DN124989_c0_g1~~TRINITY_DN124989_c0_g1_i1.p2  ORF type:complete len:149 (+),score=14.15 TRINITY_DN124989_c0_g1_i1:330-776(+)